ncbi:hypothetical protein ACH0CM_20615 [Streptomyces albus]|uniref:hypothetical protein n=1 Tax=Streptomyces albus TaxID=1888 RepID=UPI0033FD203F
MSAEPSARVLGRGVAQLIPQPSAAVSPADQAAAALAALQTRPVHVGVLQAAALLLEETARAGEDETVRSTAAATAGLLRAAMEQPAATDT